MYTIYLIHIMNTIINVYHIPNTYKCNIHLHAPHVYLPVGRIVRIVVLGQPHHHVAQAPFRLFHLARITHRRIVAEENLREEYSVIPCGSTRFVAGGDLQTSFGVHFNKLTQCRP